MLTNPEFVAWANENVVVVIGHKGSTHAPEAPAKGAKDPKTGKDANPPEVTPSEPAPASAPGECSLYPGITCAEHEQILKDATDTGSPKVDVKGYPTSWMIAPDGTTKVHQADRQPKPCMDGLIDFAKKSRLKITGKKYLGYLQTVADGDKAAADGRWKDALAAYAKIDAEGKRLSALQMDLKRKLAALNERVAAAFAKAKDGDGDAAAKWKAVTALRADASLKLSVGALPVVAEIDAWLKANPAPTPAK